MVLYPHIRAGKQRELSKSWQNWPLLILPCKTTYKALTCKFKSDHSSHLISVIIHAHGLSDYCIMLIVNGRYRVPIQNKQSVWELSLPTFGRLWLKASTCILSKWTYAELCCSRQYEDALIVKIRRFTITVVAQCNRSWPAKTAAGRPFIWIIGLRNSNHIPTGVIITKPITMVVQILLVHIVKLAVIHWHTNSPPFQLDRLNVRGNMHNVQISPSKLLIAGFVV